MSSQSEASLYVRAGPSKGQIYPLAGAAITLIGRAPSNHVVLSGRGVSAYHCVLVPDGSGRGFLLLDARSRAGTFVNGHRVKKGTVTLGDVITVGLCELVLREGAPSEGARRPERPPSSQLARFELVPRQGRAKHVPLPPASALVVGRGAIAHVRLHDPRASRFHCLIALDPSDDAQVPFVIDLGSGSRTYIRRRSIHRKHLRLGDVLTIGHTELELRQVRPPQPEAKARPRGHRVLADAPGGPEVVTEPGAEAPAGAPSREDAYLQQAMAAQRRQSWAEASRAPSILSRLRPRLLIGAVVFLPAALTAVALAFWSFQPYYRAEATVQVHAMRPRATEGPATPPPDYETFFNTQLAIVGSDAVLARCLSDPAVQDASLWGKNEDRLRVLRQALEVKRVPGTQLLSVSVRGSQPRGLSGIANAVVRAYVACLDETENAPERRRAGALEDRRRDLQQEIGTKTAVLAQLRAASAAQAGATSPDALAITQKAIADVEAKRATLAARLDSLRSSLNSEDVPLPAARVEEALDRSPAVQELAKLREELLGKLLATKGEATEESRQALRKQLESVEKQLQACRADTRPKIVEQLKRDARDALRAEARDLEADLAACAASERVLKAMLAEQMQQRGVAEGKAVGTKALEDDLSRARQSLLAIEQSLHELAAAAAAPGYVSIASMAVDPTAPEPYVGQRLTCSLLGAGVAVGLAVLAMLLADRRDDRIRSPEDLCLSGSVELLGCVSQWSGSAPATVGKPVLFCGPKAATFAAEDMQDLMLSVLHPADGKPAHVLLVTSAGRGDGKTTLAVNLAACMAGLGKQVLLVDADSRKADVARALGVENVPGLSGLLAQGAELAAGIRATAIPGLAVLSAGSSPAGVAALLSSAAARDALAGLRSRYDHILLDGPPLAEPEARVLVSLADGIILTCRAGTGRRRAVHTALRALRRLGARTLGVAVLGVPAA